MRRLRKRTADAWRPRTRHDPDKWIAARVRLSDLEAAKGRYDLQGRPWWREVLRAIADPVTRSIRLKAATQVGKTLSLMAAILYLAENAPASALVVLPSQADTQEFRERLYALAAESGIDIPPESKWNMRHMDLGGMRIYLAWSGSRRRLRGRRCKYVFLSEVDVYASDSRAANPLEAAKQRVKAFPRHLILYESSPIPEPSNIDTLERQSRRHRWQCQCPHCGTWQEPRFFLRREDNRGGVSGLKDKHDQFLDRDEVLTSAHYVCSAGCTITNEQKELFAASGQWVPEGCRLTKKGRLAGEPDRGRRDVGFHLWAFHSSASWGEIAREYVLAVAGGTVPAFWQHELGWSYKARVTMPHWKELAERLSVPDHKRGTVPPGAWFLTGSADVQQNEVYVVVRAWGDRRTSWLVDWFVFDREEDDETELVKSDLVQINQVMDRWFPLNEPNPRGQHRLKIALLGIDANYRTLDVHNWVRSHKKTTRVRAVRGDGAMKPSQKYIKSVVKESRRERDDGSGPVVYEGGLELWSINVNAFRIDLVERFRGRADKSGAWLLPGDVMQSGRHYLQQLVNEPPTYERGKDGRPRLVFKERDRNLGHDFWDCEVNGSAIAQMIVDQLPNNPGWDASKWRIEKKKRKSGKRNAPNRAAR